MLGVVLLLNTLWATRYVCHAGFLAARAEARSHHPPRWRQHERGQKTVLPPHQFNMLKMSILELGRIVNELDADILIAEETGI